MKPPVPTEAQEARALMQWLKLKGYKFTHIKNETGRSVRGQRVQNWRAIWDARDGVSKGFPDFAIIAENNLIFIELKRTKGSRVSPEQKQWLDALSQCNVPAAVCYGAEGAIAYIGDCLRARTASSQRQT